MFVSDIPKEAEVYESESEILTFVGMPRDLQRGDAFECRKSVIGIYEVRVRARRGETKDGNVILIFHYGADSFKGPDIDAGIGNHASVAARTGTAKGQTWSM